MAGGARDSARRWRIGGVLGLLAALALVVVFAAGLHRWWYLAVAAYWVAQGAFWIRAGRRREQAGGKATRPAAAPATGDPAGAGPATGDPAGAGPADADLAGAGPAGADPAGAGPAGADLAGAGPADADPAGAADPAAPRRVRDPTMIQGAAAYGRAFGYIADREARREAAARHEAELVERARKVTERDTELRAELAAFLAEQAAETLRREQAEAEADDAARTEGADGSVSPPR